MIDTETQAEGETGRVQVGNGDRKDTEVGEIDKVQMGRTMRQGKWKTDPQRWDQNRSRKRDPGRYGDANNREMVKERVTGIKSEMEGKTGVEGLRVTETGR